jgi:hypothetical protein
MRAEDILAIIADKDVDRIKKLKKTAPDPDGAETKHLQSSPAREALRYLYNIISISGLQQADWEVNRTTLIPKPSKDPVWWTTIDQ